MAEWKCVLVGHHDNIGKVIEEWEKARAEARLIRDADRLLIKESYTSDEAVP